MSTLLETPVASSAPQVHRTTLTEQQVMDYFWAACREGADRLSLLLQISVVAVPTAPGWSAKDVRRAFQPRPHTFDGCFSCFRRDRRVAWHHVIAIDHGGSNDIWNQVELCHVCHRRIHPWLEDEPDHGTWTSAAQLGDRLLSGHLKLAPERRQVHDDDGRGLALRDVDEDEQYARGEWE